MQKPTGTLYARTIGFTNEKVYKFYLNYTQDVETKRYIADRIWNADETGLSIAQSKVPQVIGLIAERQIEAITSAETSSLITVIVSMNTSGNFVSPLVTFPHSNMSTALERGKPFGTIVTVRPSGWVQSHTFT